MTATVYKIEDADAWSAAIAAGLYEGSNDDRRDGFIHFSTAEQLAGTAAKHFANRPNLVIVAVFAQSLGDALKWEASRGGALFPHLYAALDPALCSAPVAMPLGDDGIPQLPETLPSPPEPATRR